MREPVFCKICDKAWPLEDHYIGNLGLTKAYVFEDQYFAGWTVLVLHDHRTELFQLTRDERRRLMEEISRTGEALTKIFDVRKINSELLGNQVPHMHWHIIPRLKAEPAPLQPVWCVAHKPVSLTADLLAERILQFRSALEIP